MPPVESFVERIPYEVGALDLRILTTDDEHNADGTYSFPPAPRNARQAIAFWLRCSVPDHVLRSVRLAHTTLMRERQAEAEEVLSKAAVTGRAKERRVSAEAELANVRFIDPRNLRSLVRVARLADYAADLPQAEQYKVYNCVFTLDTGERITPVEAMELYDMNTIWASLEDNRERRDQAQYEAIVETRNIWARSVNSATPLRPY